jgi:opacity protein-like surface antigen
MVTAFYPGGPGSPARASRLAPQGRKWAWCRLAACEDREVTVMFKRVAAVCVVVLAAAQPAAAQEKPYSFMAGGVLMAPLSNSADRFSMGLGFTGGVAWRFTSDLSLTADYLWSTLGVQEDSAATSASRPAEVTPRIQFGTVNIKFQSAPGRARLHLLAGGGIYHRSVGLSASGSGNVSVCDPWWFLCPPGPIPVSAFNGTRTATNPGLNFGVGLTAGRFFAEVRYHFMWGPKFETSKGTEDANGKFFPLTVGINF